MDLMKLQNLLNECIMIEQGNYLGGNFSVDLAEAQAELDQAKQLLITDVVSSLPSKEEMEMKLNFLIENKAESFNKYDEITFKFGFRTCFYWLEKILKK